VSASASAPSAPSLTRRPVPQVGRHHLEAGPRAENNNADWALVYQQKSVPEDATFPEHAVQRAPTASACAAGWRRTRSGTP
jgi:hypothetical protein